MSDSIDLVLVILSALFPIVDPLGGSPIFLALTREFAPPVRRAIAFRITIYSFVLMIGSYFIGSHVLGFFGVSLPIVQVAGGLVVTGLGWSLLMAKDDSSDVPGGRTPPANPFSWAFYPLTLPLTVGPGSISVAVTLGANATHHYGVHPAIIVAAFIGTALIAASIYFCYAFADRLARLLGETGTLVIIRLSAFLLVCIGVQIIWNGASELLASVPWHTR